MSKKVLLCKDISLLSSELLLCGKEQCICMHTGKPYVCAVVM